MNKLEAKIVILEDLLINCEFTISFLHNCLSDTEGIQYNYEYPDQTINLLQKLQKTIKTSNLCYHSSYTKDCNSCKYWLEHRKRLNEARNAA